MAKYAAKGAIIKSGSSASPTTTLTQLKSVSLTIGERELLDATTHDSSTAKEYVAAGVRDTSMVEAEILYDPADATHEAVRAAQAAGTTWYWTVILPDTGAAQWAMSGVIRSFSLGSLDPVSGLIQASISFKALAVETFTA